MRDETTSTPINAAIVSDHEPVNSIASAQRCVESGCDSWAIAGSRFCSTRKTSQDLWLYYGMLIRSQTKDDLEILCATRISMGLINQI
ncbi:unnamed protein product [Periconia digitata]|uniref:Uncharacterized protein n=1 Tax=Periconia digitata TaxID=1303443 RepID=A0A9W4UEE7_9PLEO|nr:unnamed protein product [Periconia digitata]